jgi:hypothetical protein
MATLNINGKRVKVSDDFLRMTPEQQNAAVEEIAGSIGGQQPAPVQPPAATGPATPPTGLKPGTREYADWAAQTARAGQALPQVSNPAMAETQSSILDPFVQGTTFGFADELRGAVQGGLAAMQGGDFGSVYDQTVDESRSALAHEREVNPWGSVAAEVAGAIPTGMGVGGQLAGKGATLGMRALTGLGVGAGQGALYGAGSNDGDLADRGKGALLGGAIGGAVGGAIPLASNAIAQAVQKGQQGSVLNAAARAAPSADELKTAASQVFEQATGGTPLAISDNAFFRFLGGVKAQADKLRINSNLDQKAVGLLEVLMQTADDLSRGGTVVDMKDLHIIRQAAQKVALSSEGRDAAFANTIIRQFDDFVQTLKPADILGGADPSQAAGALMKGISGWSRANKVGMIEEAIRVGQLAASGPEKGIRNALRALARNPDAWRRFSTAEQQAIMDVVEGTGTSNLLKLIGTFGFGGNTATNGIGGAAGMALGTMAGGPVGMVAGPVIGSLAKAGSERMTGDLAQRALGAVATEGLKVIPKVNPNQATMLEQVLRRTALPATAPLIQAR